MQFELGSTAFLPLDFYASGACVSLTRQVRLMKLERWVEGHRRTHGPWLPGCIKSPLCFDFERVPGYRRSSIPSASGRLPPNTTPKATLKTAGLVEPAGQLRDGKRWTRPIFQNPEHRKTTQQGLRHWHSKPGVPRSTGVWPAPVDPPYNQRPLNRESAHPVIPDTERVVSSAATVNDKSDIHTK